MLLDLTCGAHADPTRRAILETLAQGRSPAGAGLLRNQRAGKGRLCHLQPAPPAQTQARLDFHHRFRTDSFDRLDAP